MPSASMFCKPMVLTETTGAAFAALPHHNVIGSVGRLCPAWKERLSTPNPAKTADPL